MRELSGSWRFLQCCEPDTPDGDAALHDFDEGACKIPFFS